MVQVYRYPGLSESTIHTLLRKVRAPALRATGMQLHRGLGMGDAQMQGQRGGGLTGHARLGRAGREEGLASRAWACLLGLQP